MRAEIRLGCNTREKADTAPTHQSRITKSKHKHMNDKVQYRRDDKFKNRIC